MTLQQAFDSYLPLIDDELKSCLRPLHDRQFAYYGMMHYHLGWVNERLEVGTAVGGKRLRPLLCLLICRAAGGDERAALPAAAAIEILHNFSLVHDDIEDNSPTRRGRAALRLCGASRRPLTLGMRSPPSPIAYLGKSLGMAFLPNACFRPSCLSTRPAWLLPKASTWT